MDSKSALRFRLEFAAVRLVRAGLRPLPIGGVRVCGRLLGWLTWLVDGFHRRIALDNLSHAFPTRSPRERRAIARRMFMHFGALLLELIRFDTLSDDQMRARVESEGEERVFQAYEQGRGLLFVTGHFGYWEMQAIVGGLRTPRPMSVLARPMDNPYLHAMLERIRTRTGNGVIYRQGALRKILRELSSNHGVAILIDQHLHADTVMVDFFHRPAATTAALAALALRTGAVVIPVFALPLPGGRYRFVYEPAVPPPSGDSPDAIREFTQRCTDVLEMYVRRNPHLWLWMHRRWRPVEPEAGSRSE
jgi:KDO2-lipid IV(A) lauroyltransferase